MNHEYPNLFYYYNIMILIYNFGYLLNIPTIYSKKKMKDSQEKFE